MILNIIFTTKTFKYFRLFTETLSDNADVGIRLVANQLDDDELKLMRQICEQRHNYQMYIYQSDTGQLAKHHEVVTQLFEKFSHENKLFTYVDSDIFASGNYMSEIVESLKTNDVVCTGSLEWVEDNTAPAPNPDLPLWGRHYYSHKQDLVYGSSYFCFYKVESVRRVMDKYGVDFGVYQYTELPNKVRKLFTQKGLVYKSYDTSKTLNILIGIEGGSVSQIESENLHHIGGMSWYLSIYQEKVMSRHNRELASLLKSKKYLSYLKARFQNYQQIESRVDIKVDQDRYVFAKYFADLLISLVDGTKTPKTPENISASLQEKLINNRDYLLKWAKKR